MGQVKRKKENNTYVFKSFNELISEIKITSLSKEGKHSEIPEDEETSYFGESLQRWRELNLSKHFDDFYHEVRGKCNNLMMVLHNQDYLLEAVDRHLRVPDSFASEALLDLTIQLSKDLQEDFHSKHFPRIHATFSHLLLHHHHNPHLLTHIFTAYTFIFKALQKQFLNDIGESFSTFSNLLHTSIYKPYVVSFACEAFSFLIRKYKDQQYVMKVIMLQVNQQPQLSEGVSMLLFDVVKGVKLQFHSKTSMVLQILLDLLETEPFIQEFQPNGCGIEARQKQTDYSTFGSYVPINAHKTPHKKHKKAPKKTPITDKPLKHTLTILWHHMCSHTTSTYAIDLLRLPLEKFEKLRQDITENKQNETKSTNNDTTHETSHMATSHLRTTQDSTVPNSTTTQNSTKLEILRYLLRLLLLTVKHKDAKLYLSFESLSKTLKKMLGEMEELTPVEADLLHLVGNILLVETPNKELLSAHARTSLIAATYRSNCSVDGHLLFTQLIVALPLFEVEALAEWTNHNNSLFKKQLTNDAFNSASLLVVSRANQKLFINNFKLTKQLSGLCCDKLKAITSVVDEQNNNNNENDNNQNNNKEINGWSMKEVKEIWQVVMLVAFDVHNNEEICTQLQLLIRLLHQFLLQHKQHLLHSQLMCLLKQSIITLAAISSKKRTSAASSSHQGSNKKFLNAAFLTKLLTDFKNEDKILLAVESCLCHDPMLLSKSHLKNKDNGSDHNDNNNENNRNNNNDESNNNENNINNNNTNNTNTKVTDPIKQQNKGNLAQQHKDTLFHDWMSLLKENLCSCHAQTRLLTIKILNSFFPALPSNADENFLEVCLKIEQTQVVLSDFKAKICLLERLNYEHVTKKLPIGCSHELPLRYLIGQLYNNFQLLIKPASSLIAGYAHSMKSNDFWNVLAPIIQLASVRAEQVSEEEKEDEDEKGAEDEVDKKIVPKIQKILNEEEEEDVITRMFKKHCGVAGDKVDHFLFRERLWSCMKLFPSEAQAKSRIIIPLFLSFLQKEFAYTWDNLTYAQMYPPLPGRLPCKNAHRGLLAHLSLLSSFNDPSNMHQQALLHSLYMELLKMSSPEVQKHALTCILNYNSPHLKPYRENLERLLDEKTMSNEMLKFTPDDVTPSCRAAVVEVVMRILLGKMRMRKKGMEGQRLMGKISAYLGGFEVDESSKLLLLLLEPLRHLVADDFLGRVKKMMRGEEEVSVPMKKQIGMLLTLDTLMKRMGLLLKPHLDDVFNIILLLIGQSNARFSSISQSTSSLSLADQNNDESLVVAHSNENLGQISANKTSKSLKSVRSLAVSLLNEFFGRYADHNFSKQQLEVLFTGVLVPMLLKLPHDTSQSPSHLLKLLLTFSLQPRFHCLFAKCLTTVSSSSSFSTPISILLSYLQQSPNITISTLIHDVIHNLLTISKQEEEEEDNGVVDDDGDIFKKSKVGDLDLEGMVHLKANTDLPIGKRIVLQQAEQLIRLLSSSVAKLHAKQLSILACIGEHIEEKELSEKICKELLMKMSAGKGGAKMGQALSAVQSLLANVQSCGSLMRPLSTLFYKVKQGNIRVQLCNILQLMAQKEERLLETSEIIKKLNALVEGKMEEVDYVTRMDAFNQSEGKIKNILHEIDDCIQSKHTFDDGFFLLDELVLLISNFTFFLSNSDDLATRDNSLLCLKKIVQWFAEEEEKNGGYDDDKNNSIGDEMDTNNLIDEGIDDENSINDEEVGDEDIEMAVEKEANHTKDGLVDVKNERKNEKKNGKVDCRREIKKTINGIVVKNLKHPQETHRNCYVHLLIYMMNTYFKKKTYRQTDNQTTDNTNTCMQTNKDTESSHPYEQLMVLRGGGNEEQDFFLNIAHFQMSRKCKALRKLATVLPQNNTITSKTASTYLLPLVISHLHHPSSLSTDLIDSSLAALSSIAALLPWEVYYGLLKRQLKSIEKSIENHEYSVDKVEKGVDGRKMVVREIICLLGSFPFDLSRSLLKKQAALRGDSMLKEDMQTNNETNTQLEQSTKVESKMEIEESTQTNTQRSAELSVNKLTHIHKVVTNYIMPVIFKCLTHRTRSESTEADDTEVLRIPMALAASKLLLKMPPGVLEKNMHGLVAKLCYFLNSRSLEVRHVSRNTLKKMAVCFGGKHLKTIFGELKSHLNRGYQLHVLSFSAWSILNELHNHNLSNPLSPAMTVRDLDESMPVLLEIFEGDLVGAGSEEKEVEKIKRNLFEARGIKAFDALRLMTSYSSPSSLPAIIVRIKELTEETRKHKVLVRLEEVMMRMVRGVLENQSLPLPFLLQLIYSLVAPVLSTDEKKEKVTTATAASYSLLLPVDPSKPRPQSVASNQHLVWTFALKLLHRLLKKHQVSREEVDSFVAVLCFAADHKQLKVAIESLKCLNVLCSQQLPSFHHSINMLVDKLFVNATSSSTGGLHSQLVECSFKVIETILTHMPSHPISSSHLHILLLHADKHLHHHASFSIIMAVLKRKLQCPELTELLQRVQQLSITAADDVIKAKYRKVMMTYLLDYPLDFKTMASHVSFYARQLEYEMESGRVSSLAMIRQMIEVFPQPLLDQHSSTIFLQLSLSRLNESSHSTSLLLHQSIHALSIKVSCDQRSKLVKLALEWMANHKTDVRTMASIVVKELMTSSNKDHYQEVLKIVEACLGSGTFESSDVTEQRSNDRYLFHTLDLILAMATEHSVFLDVSLDDLLSRLLNHLENLMKHSHDGVRKKLCQIFNILLQAINKDYENEEEEDGGMNGDDDDGIVNKKIKITDNYEHTGEKKITYKNGNAVDRMSRKRKIEDEEKEDVGRFFKPRLRYFREGFVNKIHTLVGLLCHQFSAPIISVSLATEVTRCLRHVALIIHRIEMKTRKKEEEEEEEVKKKKKDIKNDNDEDNDYEDNINGDGDNDDDGGEKGVSVGWLLRRVLRETWMEVVHNPKCATKRLAIFVWQGALISLLGGDCIRTHITTFLTPLLRQALDNSPIHEGTLKEVVSGVLEEVQKEVGIMFYSKMTASINKKLNERKSSKKIKRKQLATTNPELFVKRKIKKNRNKKMKKKH